MQKHYKFARFEEKSPVNKAIDDVEEAMRAVGRPIDLRGHLQARPGTDVFDEGYLITPDYTDALENYLDNVPWLSIGESLAGYFGDATGSTEMTHVVVENDLSILEVVELLDETKFGDGENSMLDTLEIGISLLCQQPKNPNDANLVVAYDLFRKSLGWMAEKLLAETDDFGKAAASHDKWGVDLMAKSDVWSDYDFSEKAPDLRGFQLKTMQRVTSQGLHKEDHEHPHLNYAWTNDGLILADMDERSTVLEGNTRGTDLMAREVSEIVGCTATNIKKSTRGGVMKGYGRPARVIAKN